MEPVKTPAEEQIKPDQQSEQAGEGEQNKPGTRPKTRVPYMSKPPADGLIR